MDGRSEGESEGWIEGARDGSMEGEFTSISFPSHRMFEARGDKE